MDVAARRPPMKARLRPAVSLGLLCVTAVLTTCAAQADLLTTINAMRVEGCAGERPAASVVEPSEALNDVARELSRPTG